MKLTKAPGMDKALYEQIKYLRKESKNFILSFILSQSLGKDCIEIKDGTVCLKNEENKNILSFPYQTYSDSIKKIMEAMTSLSAKEMLCFPKEELENIQKFLKITDSEIEPIVKKTSLFLLSADDGMKNYNEEFEEQFSQLFTFTKKHIGKENIYHSYRNSFYQDMNGDIVLSNQNYSYLIKKENNKIHVIVKNDETDPEEALNNHFIFSQKDPIKNKESTLFFYDLEQPFVLYYFMLDLDFILNSYKKDHSIVEEINPIVKSYEYYLAYHMKNYNVTKEHMLWRLAFYNFDIASDSDGNMFFGETLKYNRKAEIISQTIHKNIGHSDFDVPVILDRKNIKKNFNKIKNVNDSWKLFFKELHENLEKFIEKYHSLSKEEQEKYNKYDDNFIENVQYCSDKSKVISGLNKKNNYKRK